MVGELGKSEKVKGEASQITFLFDVKLMRPSCLQLQEVAKTDWMMLMSFFPPSTWLTNERAAPIRVTGTAEEWRRVVELAKKQGVFSREPGANP